MERTTVEICAGAGGQALGLEEAGFGMLAAAELDGKACATLRANRPSWDVRECDVRDLDGREFRGLDLFAGGVPCPPFSIAGKQLGTKDERDLFPEALRLIRESKPAAVMLENVRGFATERFASYREKLRRELREAGLESDWRVLQASDFGVPQLRPRFILVAMKPKLFRSFEWPAGGVEPPTVGKAVGALMSARRWPGAAAWRKRADGIAPTLVGGSKKHGGPDLGPTRAKRQWAELGVDGMGIADQAPGPDFPVSARPRLTVRMAARLQGFPDEWQFIGGKTAAYRQVGNAFPPPVAQAVAESIMRAFNGMPARVTSRQERIELEPIYAEEA
ncbi:MAG: DNA cytosine methyltransferase [Candidatus Eisenbacteria bacterium]|uniref:Cytosine-specific methyltransferase n=1 Tax=Eiseniibacteriota bacterium TaxID=2212470 RepID=A0A933W9A5_UNCEI|nr:DNA cytosine methyltransferase [Candidatus Eisenbacteria bacterium]